MFGTKVKKCAPFTINVAHLGEINCAPFCALFGSIMCAFEFRIIRHSGLQKDVNDQF